MDETNALNNLMSQLKEIPFEDLQDPKVKKRLQNEQQKEKARFDALIAKIIKAAQSPSSTKDVKRLVNNEIRRQADAMI